MRNAVLSEEGLAILRDAHYHLGHPSLAARLTNFVGLPLEQGIKLLPRRCYEACARPAEQALGWAIVSRETRPASGCVQEG